jgi:hypothetical protein
VSLHRVETKNYLFWRQANYRCHRVYNSSWFRLVCDILSISYVFKEHSVLFYSRLHNATVVHCSNFEGWWTHRMLVQILKFISDIRIFRLSFCLVAYDTLDFFYVTLRRVNVSETVTDTIRSRSCWCLKLFIWHWQLLANGMFWLTYLNLRIVRQ